MMKLTICFFVLSIGLTVNSYPFGTQSWKTTTTMTKLSLSNTKNQNWLPVKTKFNVKILHVFSVISDELNQQIQNEFPREFILIAVNPFASWEDLRNSPSSSNGRIKFNFIVLTSSNQFSKTEIQNLMNENDDSGTLTEASGRDYQKWIFQAIVEYYGESQFVITSLTRIQSENEDEVAKIRKIIQVDSNPDVEASTVGQMGISRRQTIFQPVHTTTIVHGKTNVDSSVLPVNSQLIHLNSDYNNRVRYVPSVVIPKKSSVSVDILPRAIGLNRISSNSLLEPSSTVSFSEMNPSVSNYDLNAFDQSVAESNGLFSVSNAASFNELLPSKNRLSTNNMIYSSSTPTLLTSPNKVTLDIASNALDKNHATNSLSSVNSNTLTSGSNLISHDSRKVTLDIASNALGHSSSSSLDSVQSHSLHNLGSKSGSHKLSLEIASDAFQKSENKFDSNAVPPEASHSGSKNLHKVSLDVEPRALKKTGFNLS